MFWSYRWYYEAEIFHVKANSNLVHKMLSFTSYSNLTTVYPYHQAVMIKKLTWLKSFRKCVLVFTE